MINEMTRKNFLVTFKSIGKNLSRLWNYMVKSIYGHANLLKAISISSIAGGLIFEGLRHFFLRIARHSAMGLGA